LINTNTGFVHSLGSGVGFDDSPSTHDNHTFERPFGQTLPIFADFGVELPDPATATHYRVSWKPIADSDIEANWNILENPINRAYVDNVQGADLITRPVNGSFLLNDPAHSGFYKIPQDNPLNQVEIPVPAAPQVLLDRDWKDGPEFKIAEWVTNTSKEITTKTIPPGVYHLRIELCREVGGILQPASVRREIFQMPTLASNFLVGDLADEPHLYGYNSVDGSARGFLLTLAIDNRSCTSSIDNAQVNGNPADPNCGLLFADLASKNTGRLGFSAAHPANKGTFYFDMVRGNNQITGLTDVPTNGVLGDNPAVNNYALSGDNYSRNNFDVDAWLAAGSCAQGAAFSETLSVKAMATDGSNRLGLYDAAQRVAAFAVVQECDCAEG